MMKETHQYIKSKIKALRAEYKGKDFGAVLEQANHKCSICSREDGDTYLFGPTLYLKKQLQFKVKIHIHVIKNEKQITPLVICDGCHLAYHLFNRLLPSAKFGSKTLSKTVYKKE